MVRLAVAVAAAAFVLTGSLNAHAACQRSSSFKFEPVFDDDVKGRVIYNGLTRPRGIKFDSADPANLLVVDVGVGVVALQQRDCGWEHKVVLENQSLTHGLALRDGLLYVSTADLVLEYQYDANSASVSGGPRTVVRGMVTREHSTRTLLVDGTRIIVSRGSQGNLDLETSDPASGRSQIRRFDLSQTIPDGGIEWLDGELLAYGMRNAVAIALSRDGTRLWEAENSADDISYQGIDVHEDNPAEELNVVDLTDPASIGRFYGYPNCFTVWNFTASGGPSIFTTGDQFSINNNETRDDAWCADTANNVRPVLSLMAHSAPLDIKFYTAPSENEFRIEDDWDGHALVSFHGSWNREHPTGYGVVRIPFNGNAPVASNTSGDGYSFVVQAKDLSQCEERCIRPVGLDFDSRGRLFVSSDTTGEIFVIEDDDAPSSAALSQFASRICTTTMLAVVTMSLVFVMG